MGQVGAHLCSVCSLIVREWRRSDVEVTSMACVPVELRSQIGTLDHCIDVSIKFPLTRTSPLCFATIHGNDGLVALYMSRATEPRQADTTLFLLCAMAGGPSLPGPACCMPRALEGQRDELGRGSAVAAGSSRPSARYGELVAKLYTV
jgi:hypothetical protein